jgi:hypothetical protein
VELQALGPFAVPAYTQLEGKFRNRPENVSISQRTIVKTAVYLGGGQGFGIVVSRNLTPDKTGRPAGLSMSDFLFVMKTGIDLDHWHPTFPPPNNIYNGRLLQVMPWPILQNLLDDDLQAIYEYLSAVPCLEGDPGNPKGSDTHGMRCH